MPSEKSANKFAAGKTSSFLLHLECSNCGREYSTEQIQTFYQQRGTSEQFHSELKTDLDLERLPSGKFQTNQHILDLGMIAYNILRLLGQQMLATGQVPGRKAESARLRGADRLNRCWPLCLY